MSNSALYQPAEMDNVNSTADFPWNNSDFVGLTNSTADTGPNCGLFKFLLYTIAMGLTCILGFVGNSVSFLVLHKDNSTPVASFLLKALAIADNFFLVLWMIHYSIREFIKYLEIPTSELDPAWLYIRVYTFPLLYMTQTLTIWLTVVISLNRFMAVCLPYRAPYLCNITNVYKEVAAVTIFSIVYNIPRFFELMVVSSDLPRPVWNRTELGRNPVYKQVYTDAMYYIFSFVLPLLILAFVNTRVIIAYQAIQARKHRMLSRRSDRENNITLVMIMVVVIFMLCQAPARIVQMVWNYTYTHCQQFQFYLIHISNTLEVLNSSLNFIVYYTFHTKFREIFLKHFCCCDVAAPQRRRDSTRFTVTEGLTLDEMDDKTCKNGTSLKRNTEHARNGDVTNVPEMDNGKVTMETGDVAEEETLPLKDAGDGDEKPADLVKEESASADAGDDASQPLYEGAMES